MRAGKASGLKSLFITFLIILTVYFLIITASQSREDAESGSEPGVVSAPSGAASADPSDTPSDAPPVSDTTPESRPETPTDFTAEQLEYVKELESVLEDLLGRFHLPKSCAIPPEALLEAARADKKRRGESITLIQPRQLGECVLRKTDYSGLAQVLEKGMAE